MSQAPLRQCNRPGCRTLTRNQGGRCDAHQQRERQPDNRANSYQRGYDKRWAAFRKWFLACNPLCVDCESEGRTTAAAEVHHKVKVADDPSLKLDEDNCMALCKRHHSRRTRRGE